ncbi:MAG: DUF5105 domain-containing protein [Firmicutes bacterium]|nr:DUF5105 domain-containing protein [Bacillota bacterium]
MKNIRKFFALSLIIVMAFTLASCGGAQTPAEPEEPEDTPTMALDTMLKSIQDLDFETAQQYYSGDMGSLEGMSENASSETAEVVDKMLKDALNFEYALDNEVISSDGQTATVDIVFTTYNMGEIFEKIIEELTARATVLQEGGMTADQFQTEMNNIVIGIYNDILKTAEKNLEISLTVNLTKVDGQWKVDDLKDSTEFLDALTGGLISYNN